MQVLGKIPRLEIFPVLAHKKLETQLAIEQAQTTSLQSQVAY